MTIHDATTDMLPDTLPRLLERAAARWPDHDALVFPDARHSFASLRGAAESRARSLRALGIGPGDHVGVLMPNCPEYIELLFAVTLLGAVAVPMNARYRAPELGYVVANADLVGIVTSDAISEYADFAALLAAGLPGLEQADSPEALSLACAPLLRFVVMLGDTRKPWLVTEARFAELDAHEPLEDAAQQAAAAIMMYTSGTTAEPKGCPLDNGPLVSNGIAMCEQRYFLSDNDRFWAPLPMFHMASILPLLCCFWAGAALLTMRRVEPGAALEMLESERATVAFPSFPTVTNDLIGHPTFADRDLSRLRRLNNVAPPDLLAKFQQAFPQTVQTGAYGLTEACGVIAFNHPDEDLETRLTTCGVPFDGIDVKIVDPDSLSELPHGERGEIWIRGYSVFRGYHKAPDKNAEAFHEGWFRTGDLCSVTDAGQICFHGRLKDMLKVGGENVAALEIESLLATHPAVKLAQVIGVPDTRLEEVAAAVIELNEGHSVEADALIGFCRDNLASFKVPRHVRFVTQWPMSATKVQKHRLRALFEV